MSETMQRAWELMSPRKTVRQLFSPPPGHLRAVDGLRALAVLWIILMHCVWFQMVFMEEATFVELLEGAPLWILGGPYGVDFFFVISGFLIGILLMKERQNTGRLDIKRFYIRRFLRLMPAYFVALGVYCVVVKVNCHMIWTNILYINNFFPGEDQAMHWSWSLAIEEQFYFTFPVFLILIFYPLAKRWRLPLLFALLALAFVIRGALIAYFDVWAPVPWSLGVEDERFLTWAEQLYIKPYARHGALLCGVIAAYLYLNYRVREFFEGRPTLATVGFFASLAIIAWVTASTVHSAGPRWESSTASFLFLTSYRYLLSAGVAYLLLYTRYRTDNPINRSVIWFLSWRIWYSTAQLAYSAYLLHPIVFVMVFGVLAPGGLDRIPMLVYYIVLPILAFFAAFLMYVTVEKPFMNLRDLKKGQKVPATVPAASASPTA
ncbi:MAG: acyltransferase [Acidobacteriota bacterium]